MAIEISKAKRLPTGQTISPGGSLRKPRRAANLKPYKYL